jgi:hypothetical protein
MFQPAKKNSLHCSPMTRRPSFTLTKESGSPVLPATAVCFRSGGEGFVVSLGDAGAAGRNAVRRRVCGGRRAAEGRVQRAGCAGTHQGRLGRGAVGESEAGGQQQRAHGGTHLGTSERALRSEQLCALGAARCWRRRTEVAPRTAVFPSGGHDRHAAAWARRLLLMSARTAANTAALSAAHGALAALAARSGVASSGGRRAYPLTRCGAAERCSRRDG